MAESSLFISVACCLSRPVSDPADPLARNRAVASRQTQLIENLLLA